MAVNQDFAIFKYQPVDKKGIQNYGMALLLVPICIGVFFVRWWLGMGMAVLIVVLWLRHLRADVDLGIGPRYIICGRTLVYFRNITEVHLASNSSLRLVSCTGKHLQIDLARFPTNARKADKIEKNRQAKFAKVTQKIFIKLAEQAPDAVIYENNTRRDHGWTPS